MQRLTFPAACVLQALALGDRYGFSVMETTGLPSGTVYQVLRRFERDGLLRSRWEKTGEASGEGRPRRRYYELTRDGRAALARAAERYPRQLAVLERAPS